MIKSLEYRYAALMYRRLNDDSGYFYECGNCSRVVDFCDSFCPRCGLKLTIDLVTPGVFVWSDEYYDFLEVPNHA